MRRNLLAFVAVALMACRSPEASPIPEALADEPSAAKGVAVKGVAVVELFTSEGCSSCPPADSVLARLASRPGVFALSFHVDYWDDLGWPDRFASPDNTARQRAYARALGARGLYTPELVVGGTDAFVGSDADHAQASVVQALGTAPQVRLELHARATGGDVIVAYDAHGAPGTAMLEVAVVEHSATTDVRAGENSGRTLHHVNVVRSFASARLGSETGTVSLHLPPGLRDADAEVVAYVQQRSAASGSGLPVLGAASAHIDPHE